MINIDLENMINPCQKKESVKKSATIPLSPKLHTSERSNLKDHFQSLLPEEPVSAPSFKALELNKKILTSISKLPEVAQKELT
jgi:predicted nucleotidyltransferase